MSETDFQLLARYTRHKAEDAFTELVQRHLNLVYSAALRQVHAPQLAEEVAQSTFVKLAQKARQLAPDTILTAWLYQVAHRQAIDLVRREARRQLREQIATEINAMNATADDWLQIAPLLEEAMQALEHTDRAAILLRYFENKSLREVGQTLGTNEDAAQKRVSRALERLREFFVQNGVVLGTSGITLAISANAVQAAPAGLAATVTAAALSAAASTTTTVMAAIKAITLTTAQKIIIAAGFAVAVGTGVFIAHHVMTKSPSIPMLISPTNGSVLVAGQPFTLAGRVPGSSALALEFYENGALIRAFPSPVASFSWTNPSTGMQFYSVRASLSSGSSAMSEVLKVLNRPLNSQATFFPEFTSLSGLYVTGRTAIVENWLRLTPNTPGPKGAAFLQGKQPLINGFETVFQFRISALVNTGGDGIALLIEGGPSPVLGGAIGFDGVTNCLAVEYDTFLNPTHGDPNANHVSVHSGGILANTKYESNSLGWATNIPNMSDQLVHTTKITYLPGRLSVFLDDLSTPIIQVKLNLATYLYLEDGLGWVGFTATNGNDMENHDIISWSFTATLPPSQQARQ